MVSPYSKTLTGSEKPPRRLKRTEHLPDEDLVFERHAFGIVLLEPFFRGVLIGKDLEVLGVSNLLAGVDVDEDGHWYPCRIGRPANSARKLRPLPAVEYRFGICASPNRKSARIRNAT
jgi:hypothetical protein